MAACQTVRRQQDPPDTIQGDPSTQTPTSEVQGVARLAAGVRVRDRDPDASRCLTTRATWAWSWRISPVVRVKVKVALRRPPAAVLKAIFCRP